jgi:hypothetical protein
MTRHEAQILGSYLLRLWHAGSVEVCYDERRDVWFVRLDAGQDVYYPWQVEMIERLGQRTRQATAGI